MSRLKLRNRKPRLGIALLAVDGRIFTGCNVENLSYGLTNRAKRVAMGAAVAAGVRQALAARVILVNRNERVEFPLEELLPRILLEILDPPE